MENDFRAAGSLAYPVISVIIICQSISIFILEQGQVTICKTGECAMGDKSPKNKEKKKKKQVDKQNQKKEKAGTVPPVTRA